jgi:hypothetical protein
VRVIITHGSINHWTENIRNQNFYETNGLLSADSRSSTLEEGDFDRQFLFDEYVAISHRYDLKKGS